MARFVQIFAKQVLAHLVQIRNIRYVVALLATALLNYLSSTIPYVFLAENEKSHFLMLASIISAVALSGGLFATLVQEQLQFNVEDELSGPTEASSVRRLPRGVSVYLWCILIPAVATFGVSFFAEALIMQVLALIFVTLLAVHLQSTVIACLRFAPAWRSIATFTLVMSILRSVVLTVMLPLTRSSMASLLTAMMTICIGALPFLSRAKKYQIRTYTRAKGLGLFFALLLHYSPIYIMFSADVVIASTSIAVREYLAVSLIGKISFLVSMLFVDREGRRSVSHPKVPESKSFRDRAKTFVELGCSQLALILFLTLCWEPIRELLLPQSELGPFVLVIQLVSGMSWGISRVLQSQIRMDVWYSLSLLVLSGIGIIGLIFTSESLLRFSLTYLGVVVSMQLAAMLQLRNQSRRTVV